MVKTMLLVEDSITTQKAVITAFEGENFNIVTANDAREALRQLPTLIPDIILADAAMSEIDGFHLCKLIRQTERVCHVPVLLLTSSFTAYDQDKGNAAGVTAHLCKPFEPQTLRDLVQQLVTDAPRLVDAVDANVASAAETRSCFLEGLDTALAAGQTLTESLEMLPDVEPHEDARKRTTARAESSAAALCDATDSRALYEALGRCLLPLIQESLHAHLGQLLAAVMPQIVKRIQDDVTTRMPALLEELLQREIDKLKQAVEHDAPHGDQ